MFLWGFIKAWKIQECYRQYQLKDDPTLTVRLVTHMLVRDGEQSFKAQIAKIENTTNILLIYMQRLLRIMR